MVLTDIVKRNYMSTSRKAGAAITAGDLVYLSADETVTKTANASCSGLAFEGVAMDSVAADAYLSIAVEPSEVYVNATHNITAGGYVVPDGAKVQNRDTTLTSNAPFIIIGRALTAGSTTTAPLIRLMNVPNESHAIP